MREGIGEWATYNIIIIFILIVFGLLSATISYYKAFKVNSMIIASIDKFEGYNALAREEINANLDTIGYTKDKPSCDASRGNAVLAGINNGNTNMDSSYNYCVYYYNDDRGEAVKNEKNKDGEPIYYNYSVVSYIYVDLPIVGQFKVPVYTKGERIYNFSNNGNKRGGK